MISGNPVVPPAKQAGARWAAICLALGAVFLFGLAPAWPQEKTTPKPRGLADLAPVQELPPGKVLSRQLLGEQTTQARLANGMTILIREHHLAPVATARVYVGNTGSAYEGQYLGSGISHLVEHLVSGGSTKKRNEKEIDALLNSLGASSNAYTSYDITAYHIDVPARNLNQALDVLAEAMQHCTFPDSEFEREYRVVQRELEMGEEERGRVMWNLLSQMAYREHPLRHPIIGYLPVLQALKKQDVINFYRERYQPQNLTFVVVGDVQTDQVLAELSRLFNSFKRTAEREIVMPVEPPLTSPRRALRRMEGELTNATLAWPTVSLEHPDLYALDLASFILGNGDSSRLSQQLRFKKKLVVGVGSSSYTPAQAPGWFSISMTLDPKNLDQARAAALQEAERLKHEPVSSEELAKAKKQMVANHVFGRQSVEQLAEALSADYRGTGDPLFSSFYTRRIQKVSAQDIERVARMYLTPERLLEAVIDPLDFNRGGGAAEASQAPEGKVQKHLLSNGLTVLIQPSKAAPIVHMQCIARAGTLGETDETNGVAALTAELLPRGTQKYTGDQIAEYFDRIGGSLGAASGRNTTYVACEVLREDFAAAFDYFAQAALHPTFPREEFDDRKQETLLAIGQRKANTFSEATEFFHDALPAGCSLRRQNGGRKETVEKLSLEDCRRFHARYFIPNNMVVTIFGDVEPKQALDLVERHFGGLKQAADFKYPDVVGFRLDRSQEVHRTTRRPDASVIIWAFPSTSVRDVKENDTLTLLRAILSGHEGGSGWLFRDLRGAGLVYVVYAANQPALASGYFSVIAQTRPDQLNQAVQKIKENLEKARRGEISAAEFAIAKENVLNAHARQNETLAERAQQAGFDEILGLGYDHDASYEKRLGAITLEEVKQAAKKYLGNGLLLTTGPGKTP